MTNNIIDETKHHKNGSMRIILNKGEQVFCSTMIMFFNMNNAKNVVFINFEDNDGTQYEASVRKINGKSTLKILNEMKQKIKELEAKLKANKND